MATIDVREDENTEIDVIVFTDVNFLQYDESAAELHLYCNRVYINSKEEQKSGVSGSGTCLHVDTKEDALNLIKAINKAIELGWWE